MVTKAGLRSGGTLSFGDLALLHFEMAWVRNEDRFELRRTPFGERLTWQCAGEGEQPIQGLFDRSPVLHPHPPVKTWRTQAGFETAIKLDATFLMSVMNASEVACGLQCFAVRDRLCCDQIPCRTLDGFVDAMTIKEDEIVVTQRMLDAGRPWLVHYEHMRKTDRDNALTEAFKAMVAISKRPILTD